MEEDIVSEGVINTTIIRLCMINRTWPGKGKVRFRRALVDHPEHHYRGESFKKDQEMKCFFLNGR